MISRTSMDLILEVLKISIVEQCLAGPEARVGVCHEAADGETELAEVATKGDGPDLAVKSSPHAYLHLEGFM